MADTKAGTADAGSTATILKDAARTEAEDYWNGGILEMTSGTNDGKRRQILTSVPGTITLLYAFSNPIATGDTYTIKRGCDKSISSCRDFENEINFGGFISIPRRF